MKVEPINVREFIVWIDDTHWYNVTIRRDENDEICMMKLTYCGHYNTTIELFKEDIKAIRILLDYLEKNEKFKYLGI
ncbi:MAG: hypothetical protein QXO99_08295 [Candidatus Methanomethylicia archaeon]